jgi:exopolysaccharide production protein ExoQ
MNSSLASLICACVIVGLLYLDRDKTVRVSWALWIPGIWIAIVASRPVSLWLGLSTPTNAALEGSPIDAAAFAILLVAAIAVLIHRGSRIRPLLLANWPILIYFLYCLISAAWSYHPDILLKRWIKAVGDPAMILVVVTDRRPMAAITRTVSRIGFLLFPMSVLFIKYYGDLGRGYTSDGMPMNFGVTTNKNALGLAVLVISLVVLWNVRNLLVHTDSPSRSRRLVAQGTLLAFGLLLFWMAQCSTCKACFLLGGFVMMVSNLRAIRKRPARVHVLCAAILLIAGVFLLVGGQADVVAALGRKSDMSGRTDIWAAVLPAVPNSIVGAGFESFWISPNVSIFQQTLLREGWYPPLVKTLNEAHDGYFEVYLNLGWIGIFLLALIIGGGYRRAFKAFQRSPEIGSLLLAFVAVLIMYSITEAGFRMLTLAWIFLLLAIIAATGVTVGFFGTERARVATSDRAVVRRSPLFDTPVPHRDRDIGRAVGRGAKTIR